MGTSTGDSDVELRSPAPRTTRTSQDRVMVVLGVLLTLFFIVAGYLTLVHDDGIARGQQRGPVKDPRVLTQPQFQGGVPSSPRTQ